MNWDHLLAKMPEADRHLVDKLARFAEKRRVYSATDVLDVLKDPAAPRLDGYFRGTQIILTLTDLGVVKGFMRVQTQDGRWLGDYRNAQDIPNHVRDHTVGLDELHVMYEFFDGQN